MGVDVSVTSVSYALNKNNENQSKDFFKNIILSSALNHNLSFTDVLKQVVLNSPYRKVIQSFSQAKTNNFQGMLSEYYLNENDEKTFIRKNLSIFPLRIYNKSITHNDFNNLYLETDKYFKKIFNYDISELVKNIEDIDNINDIDYAFFVFGLDLHSKNPLIKKYLYNYFMGYFDINNIIPHLYQCKIENIFNFKWDITYKNRRKYENISLNGLSEEDQLDFNITDEIINDLEKDGVSIFIQDAIQEDIDRGVGDTWERTFFIIKENNLYKGLYIAGLRHSNHIYGGYTVLTRPERNYNKEESSNFIIPLDLDTIQKFSIANRNELIFNSFHLIFNCYAERRRRWYESFLPFLILFVLVGILLPITFPKLIGNIKGLLGTNLGVGTSLGLKGSTALITGSSLNLLAGGIFNNLIIKSNLSTSEKNALAIAMFLLTFDINTIKFNINKIELKSFNDLLNLTSLGSNIYRNESELYLKNLSEEKIKLYENYISKLEKIKEKEKELKTSNTYIIDILLNKNQLNEIDTKSIVELNLMSYKELVELYFINFNNFAELNTINKLEK